jgi:hypothetical protein
MTNGIDDSGLIEELEQPRIRSSMVLSYRLILDYQCTWLEASVPVGEIIVPQCALHHSW